MAYRMRKDPQGHTLKNGECYRKDGRYSYSWTNPRGERKTIYSTNLQALRKREKQLIYDLEDGIDPLAANVVTVNQLWDKYIKQKYDLKDTTRNNYIYCYDRWVRNGFGKLKLSRVKYSDVKDFYYDLILKKGLKANTVDSVQCLLHPVFQMAIRDQLIRVNPTEGVMAEIKKNKSWAPKKKTALTVPQQKALLNYVEESDTYSGWYPVITVLLGTGMRISECLGLRWDDLNFDENYISVNHNLIYRPNAEGKVVHSIQTPKTEAGIRTIPMLPEVREAFLMEYEIQKCTGFCQSVVDDYSGFVFSSAKGNVYTPESVNNAIKRICEAYNKEETQLARKEKRSPILLPDFSCHILRHTFCTRLCESETNLKVIQSIMGHSDISTTMNIYADCTAEQKQEVLNNLEGRVIIK
ncbi:tyrosine-type recombinase/integrase [Eubacterium oxidoreducens]|uniref:Site-specific recombinase XerD n=1 Tax=Eubacterium oxidoreducens TaxID=1732 RepID=A0A1G6A1B1_EUBOX|nr:tyrosine-type recombinase/integrase [Eubacterium oxidoreducens]SDB02268.1 Site-specific recombinase XerD [Eubacterium oxidoreducens]SEI83717.1 Site-specific recombinase XerD [Lachnospiraceae bacterium A10]